MAERRNFLLGNGERLTEPVVMPGRPVKRELPYTFAQARARVLPMVRSAAEAMDSLPLVACPHDEAVGALTLNPEYIAKSYFPGDLLRKVGMRLVGSRGRTIVPQRRSRNRKPTETLTTELFVAGRRPDFRQWGKALPSWSAMTRGSQELAAVERFEVVSSTEKVKRIDSTDDELVFEIVLHATEFRRDAYILESFEEFLATHNLTIDFDRRFYAGGLCFIALAAPRSKILDVAQFSFLRVAREMPRLRVPQPMLRSAGRAPPNAKLPSGGTLDPSIRVAVFDGGLPPKTPLRTWAHGKDAQGIGRAVDGFLWHGHAVTSALIFGSLVPGAHAPRPFAEVNHFRVLDALSGRDPFQLYDVLDRIRAILTTNTFDFVNLSIGPEMPIDDDEVHAWTSMLDEYLADGNTLASIAVGNNGAGDPILGYDRVQVPSDCVNGLAVGAANASGSKWKRAAYSAIGPGRSPGIVKPDVVGFGGCETEPYFVLDATPTMKLTPTCGTSFAAPHVLRTAIGLRAQFGQLLRPLALKALLVHCADAQSHPQRHVGWGRVPEILEDLVTCPDHTVRVVYQGEINASKYLRARIPLPAGVLQGSVRICATFCFATDVDAAHPSNYTRSGLEVFFRPHEDTRDKGAMHAKTAAFFRPGELYPTEDELRRDAHKWETCLHAVVAKRGSSLKNPVFDIHYNSRLDGRNDASPKKMPYALVITVEAPRSKDLYDQVVRRFRTVLEPLTPVIQIPVPAR
jgi:Subtilase family